MFATKTTPTPPGVELGDSDVLQPGDVFRGRTSGVWMPVHGTVGKTVAQARGQFGCRVEFRRPNEVRTP